MTREEAISIMNVIVHMLEEKYDTDRVEEAVDMAIKALEQEPCEDCISREEVCDYIAEFVNHEYATDRERELVKHIIGGIQHLPSIQPTTKENLVVEDCISRKAVLDALNKWEWQELYLPVHFKDIIDDLPSIQPKTDVLNKIRAEIEGYKSTIDKAISEDELKIEGMKEAYADCLKIIDKYKAESEIHCNCTDADIAKSFIEDVEAVKELLPQDESEGKE